MQINVATLTDKLITLDVSPTDTIKNVKLLIEKKEGIESKSQVLSLGCQILEDNQTIESYNINEDSTLTLVVKKVAKYINNLKDRLINYFENNERKEIKVSEYIKNKLKKNELNVNLIHFDINLMSIENYFYFNEFKVNVVGDFLRIDDYSILEEYLEKIKVKNIPFIVITSGSCGKDVIKICLKYPIVKEVIIFCQNYKYNEHYINEYAGYVKKVLTSLTQITTYIGELGNEYREGIEKFLMGYANIFSLYDNQLQECPLISTYEYDTYYFLVHKIYSNFFIDSGFNIETSLFTKEYLNVVLEYVSKLKFEDDKEKNLIMDKLTELSSLDTNNQFVELSLREYTREGSFSYLFKKPLRNFGKGLISFAYYMGPFLYGINKYVRDNPKFAMTKKMELEKIIKCSRYDFYQYKYNQNRIVCFTSLIVTSSSHIKYNLDKQEKDDKILIRMIFKYDYEKGDISPGIVIENKKGNDGKYISSNPKDKQVILFPFTFAKISEIKTEVEKGVKFTVIIFDIINRKEYIEYLLRDNFEKRIRFDKLNKS